MAVRLQQAFSVPSSDDPDVISIGMVWSMKDYQDADYLLDLSDQSYDAFILTGQRVQLLAAKEFLELGLQLLSPDSPRRGPANVKLIELNNWYYEITRFRKYIRDAVQLGAGVVPTIPTEQPARLDAWLNIFHAIQHKIEIDEAPADLHQLGQTAINLRILLRQNAEQEHGVCLARAEFLHEKCIRAGTYTFSPILMVQRGTMELELDERQRFQTALTLSKYYYAWFTEGEDGEHAQNRLTAAIALAKFGIELSPDHPNMPLWMNSLSRMLLRQYELGSDQKACMLDEAFTLSNRALQKVAPNSPTRILILSTLIMLLERRFQDRNEATDLDSAILLAHEIHLRTAWLEKHLWYKKSRLAALRQLERLCNIKCKSFFDEKMSKLGLFATSEISRLEISIGRQLKRARDEEESSGLWFGLDEAEKLEPKTVTEEDIKDMHGFNASELDPKFLNHLKHQYAVDAVRKVFNILSPPEARGAERTADGEDTCDGTRARARSSTTWIKRLFTKRVRSSKGSYLGSKVGPFPHNTGILRAEKMFDLSLSKSFLVNLKDTISQRDETPAHAALIQFCCAKLSQDRAQFLLELQKDIEELRDLPVPDFLVYPDSYRQSNTLKSDLYLWYQLSKGDEDKFEDAIAWILEHAPLYGYGNSTDPARLQLLETAYEMLGYQYDSTGSVSYLDRAIEIQQEIINSTSGPFDSYRCIALSSMAENLHRRCMHFGNEVDMQKALVAAEESIRISPPFGILRADQWNVLADAYMMRYKHYHTSDDLARSIQILGQSVLVQNPDDPGAYARFNDLAGGLGMMYANSKALLDLEQAILLLRKASELARNEFASISVALSLAGLFGLKSERTESVECLNMSIGLYEYVLRFQPWGQLHPHSLMVKLYLADQLGTRFEKDKGLKDLKRATNLIEDVAENNLGYQRFRIEARLLLVKMLTLKADGTIDKAIIKQIVQICKEVLRNEYASVLEKIQCARHVAKARVDLGKLGKGYRYLEKAVQLTGLLNPRWMETSDQQKIAGLVKGLPADAAMLALLANKSPHEAIALAEMTRGMIVGSVIDGRSDISKLKRLEPTLWNEFEHVREQLFRSPSDENQEALYLNREQPDSWYNRRRDAAASYEKLLQEIRSRPSHERFQLPPSQEDMMQLAKDGFIVSLFFSHLLDQTRAIIISAGGFEAMDLPSFGLSNIFVLDYLFTKQSKGSLRTYWERGKRVEDCLETLWTAVVEPILDRIACISQGAALPRVWWLGFGPLSRLPFHAAGKKGKGDCCMDRVISSYIPTLKSISFAREKPIRFLDPRSARCALFYMDQTPGEVDLSGAAEEAKNLESDLQKITQSIEVHPQPSASDVLEGVKTCNIAHFACHGRSDLVDPLASCLILVSKHESDQFSCLNYRRQDKLTVRQLIEQPGSLREEAGLVFLSGCSTADNPAKSLGDESIHLATAFHLAGFSHVIGTIWKAHDRTCKDVARSFYQQLFTIAEAPRASVNADGADVARALHKAVSKLREEQTNPLAWAPFIHIGA